MMSSRTPNLAPVPHGWYYACAARDLRRGPVGLELGQRKYVAFRDGNGNAAVLDARCSHMGADLSRGCVDGGLLHCPLHDWQYDGGGRCVRIPATDEIPPFARQTAYPTARARRARRLPQRPRRASSRCRSTTGVSPDDLLPAEPFDFVVDTPWYMVGANAFDLQHFRVAHDRTLVDEPVVESPSPFARRITATYDVTGTGWRDRLTRRLLRAAGADVGHRLGGDEHPGDGGVRADDELRHGLRPPAGRGATQLRTIVWVPRRRRAVRGRCSTRSTRSSAGGSSARSWPTTPPGRTAFVIIPPRSSTPTASCATTSTGSQPSRTALTPQRRRYV